MNVVQARCYKCGMEEFTVPAGTDPRRVICNACIGRIYQKQRLNATDEVNYKIPYYKKEGSKW